MTLALLDHPWPLHSAIDAGSEGFNVLLKFVDLVRRRDLTVVPFVNQEELAAVWQEIGDRHRGTSGLAALRRFAGLFMRNAPSECVATPIPEPPGLGPEWKRALRDSVHVDDWRNPQIIVSESRRIAWGTGNTVSIGFDDCKDIPSSGPYERIVAVLDAYEVHPFALSDFDPWDLRHIHPIPDLAPAHARHACFLPKPPCLRDVPLEGIADALTRARDIGWQVDGRRYFIPTENWRPEEKSQESWRRGQAFDRGFVEARNAVGYVDYRGVKWVWHEAERHWDVQMEPYLRLRCTGEEV